MKPGASLGKGKSPLSERITNPGMPHRARNGPLTHYTVVFVLLL